MRESSGTPTPADLLRMQEGQDVHRRAQSLHPSGVFADSIDKTKQLILDHAVEVTGGPSLLRDDAEVHDPLAEARSPESLGQGEVQEADGEHQQVVPPRRETEVIERADEEPLRSDDDHDRRVGRQEGREVVDPARGGSLRFRRWFGCDRAVRQQGISERRISGESTGGFFREAPCDHLRQPRRQVIAHVRHIGRRGIDHVRNDLHGVIALERSVRGQQREQRGADGVDVRAGVHLVASQLLGRGERRRPHDLAGLCHEAVRGGEG